MCLVGKGGCVCGRERDREAGRQIVRVVTFPFYLFYFSSHTSILSVILYRLSPCFKPQRRSGRGVTWRPSGACVPLKWRAIPFPFSPCFASTQICDVGVGGLEASVMHLGREFEAAAGVVATLNAAWLEI